MTNSPEPTLLIGVGAMGRAYAKALQKRGTPLVAVGRGKASAYRFEREIGVPVGTGPLDDQLLRMGRVPPTAIVAVGITDLPAVAALLLKRGVQRILLEKPGAPTADAMAQLAKIDTDHRIRIAYNRRFLLSTLAARELVADDGGVQSFHFEFTEIPNRIPLGEHSAEVLDNWVLANSSHVLDMAFHLAGAADDLSDVVVAGARAAGKLDWHSPGSRFVGCGTVGGDKTFSFFADWTSGGGWGIELCTPKRRLRLRPLESLSQQEAGVFTVEPVEIPTEGDLKPGLPLMLEDFFERSGCGLPDAASQAARLMVYDSLIRNRGA